MNWKRLAPRGVLFATILVLAPLGRAAEQSFAFNVLSQRSVALTAQYWNPILIYVSGKSGVPLELKLAKTTKERNVLAEQGAYDFLYTNHFFTPERDRLGFRVIARPAGRGIQGQIVVPQDSPIRSLQELNGKEVAFPTPNAFAAYFLPMDAYKSQGGCETGIHEQPGSELSSAQIGTVAAAGVNDQMIQRYARREGFEYRLLWNSEIYNDLCIMVSPKVPKEKVSAVRQAFVTMMNDPEGRKVLETGAELLKIKDNLGFRS
jgi:phosphonate transport system substrate-binding protein